MAQHKSYTKPATELYYFELQFKLGNYGDKISENQLGKARSTHERDGLMICMLI
jgi:hypothetical protein